MIADAIAQSIIGVFMATPIALLMRRYFDLRNYNRRHDPPRR